MHTVTLKATRNGKTETVKLAVADAKNRDSAGRLAENHLRDKGYYRVSVVSSTVNTSGFATLK